MGNGLLLGLQRFKPEAPSTTLRLRERKLLQHVLGQLKHFVPNYSKRSYSKGKFEVFYSKNLNYKFKWQNMDLKGARIHETAPRRAFAQTCAPADVPGANSGTAFKA